MLDRKEILKKYIKSKELDDWLDKKELPSPTKILSIFEESAYDYIHETISYEEFSLICINLYFEAITFFSFEKIKPISKEVKNAIEAFADPNTSLKDSQGNVIVKDQNEILESALESLEN